MLLTENDELVKITAVGTISIPKQFRKYLGIQKGDYVKVSLQGDTLVLKRVNIS
jgi:AbrB family looped-hinge helix DNA binding protein